MLGEDIVASQKSEIYSSLVDQITACVIKKNSEMLFWTLLRCGELQKLYQLKK